MVPRLHVCPPKLVAEGGGSLEFRYILPTSRLFLGYKRVGGKVDHGVACLVTGRFPLHVEPKRGQRQRSVTDRELAI